MSTKRWYVGAMNDALFIIDKKPSPSGTDHQFFDGSPSGLVIPLGAGDPRTQELAQRIVEAHNADVLTDLRAAMIEHDKDMARLDRNTYRAAPAASDASCVHCDGPITEGILRGTWVHTNTGLTSCRKPGELSREIFHAAPPERTPVAGEQEQRLLTPEELADIECFQRQRRKSPVATDAWLYVAEIDRLLAHIRLEREQLENEIFQDATNPAFASDSARRAAKGAATEICDWCGIDSNDAERVAAIISKHFAPPD